ncbi:Zinc finger protein 62 homolog [Plakobranchus ocellatus]|uniref:Zinc finger protein 62 homolog n=1 Tax=Plakobranchus ocellatus TaxID=259542 RepID=A0AAV4ANA1_9GAST|nr:Zinc finger protein 62 homolog [Plakobranchus ocellatus]
MKCPWPNCDNWLTETGQLRPHFIAHSRALQAAVHSNYVCEVCQLAFSSRWGLMIHKRMHGDEAAAVAKPTLPRLAKFSCEEPGCPATFCDQKGFFDHFLYHYTKKPCVCDEMGCNQSFTNLITLSRHTKLHFDGKYQCPWEGCKKLFASPFIVKRHVYRHIVGHIRAAPSAPSSHSVSDVNPPMEPAQEHRDGGSVEQRDWPLSCSQCFMVFRQESNLASHMEYHSEKSEHVCPVCGKKGKHNHTKAPPVEIRPRKVHACDQCGASYATVSGLKFHQLQKHKIGKWPFKCSYCDKGFVSSREMQRHIPSHTKEKPFVCDICGASFASHTGHRAHMRKHTGQKYMCEIEGCGKIYTTAVSLRGHMAQHAGFSKTCAYCGKTYKNPYGHKCKASREGKKKLSSELKSAQDQAPQQPQSGESSGTTLHLLQPPRHHLPLKDHLHSDHLQLQQEYQHHIQQQQVLGMVQPHQIPQQQLQHQQQQLQPHYVPSSGGSFSNTPTSLPSLLPSLTQQGSMLPSSSASSIRQSQMILMAPQMLTSTSGNNNGLAFMTVPHSGNSSVSLQRHPQQHLNMLNTLSHLQPQVQASTASLSAVPPSAPLPHINLLPQGVVTVPPHNSGLSIQHQQQQSQNHLNSSISSTTVAVPEGVALQPLQRGSNGDATTSTTGQGEYVYNNYVVFWEGQM